MDIPEVTVGSAEEFATARAARTPFVIRGIVADWPAVRAGRSGEAGDYLAGLSSSEQAGCVFGPAEIGGRFFYRPDMRGFNFSRRDATVAELLAQLGRQADADAPLAMAMQSAPVDRVLPGFTAANRMALLPDAVRPRIWIGNRVRVATHYDSNDNLACVVAGRRRFTLFPPDQVGNLYPGPLEMTPAGTPVSMVDVDAPDHASFPRFTEAEAQAHHAELAPGDAIFIPYLWWHAVRSLDPVSVLVNYWWSDEGSDTAQLHAMLHALLAFRGLSAERRQAWTALFDHFVLHRNGDPAAHIAPQARGVLGDLTPTAAADLYRHLARSLAGGG